MTQKFAASKIWKRGNLSQLTPGWSVPFFLPLPLCHFQLSESQFRKQLHQQEGMRVKALCKCFFSEKFRDRNGLGHSTPRAFPPAAAHFLFCSGSSLLIHQLMGFRGSLGAVCKMAAMCHLQGS